uniref:Peroxidase n=1 Tax=Populus alba TaxID=43335 RepID=A0A4U5PNF9_POPAL|nr:peroxidase precursor family protein [Populus alba]
MYYSAGSTQWEAGDKVQTSTNPVESSNSADNLDVITQGNRLDNLETSNEYPGDENIEDHQDRDEYTSDASYGNDGLEIEIVDSNKDNLEAPTVSHNVLVNQLSSPVDSILESHESLPSKPLDGGKMAFIDGPYWDVPTGRRDGRVSIGNEALFNLPSPFANITVLKQQFAATGVSVKDLAVLSGAHTIGISHCSSFSNRLYNFTGVGDQDPALDSEYAANLKARKCRSLNDNTTIVEMDPGSFRTFDLSYYSLLLKRRGLFQSDSALTTNSATLSFVNQLLQGPLQNFFGEFANSMEKMGRVNVKTGTTGEIRKHCAFVNS